MRIFNMVPCIFPGRCFTTNFAHELIFIRLVWVIHDKYIQVSRLVYQSWKIYESNFNKLYIYMKYASF